MDEDLDEEREIKEEDARVQMIAIYTIRSFPIKAEKWLKMMQQEDNVKAIMQFMDDEEKELLVIQMNTAGQLLATNSIPVNPTSKYSYFIKVEPAVITVQNFREVLHFGDMMPNAVEGAAFIFEKVLAPILADSKEVSKYPDVTRRSLRNNVLHLRDHMIRLKGELKGLQLLPIPMDMDRIKKTYEKYEEDPETPISFDMISALQKSVITWYEVIHDFCQRSGDRLFETDPNCKPDAEVKFWSSRVLQLDYLYEQLRSPEIRLIANFLEKTKNVVYSTFVRGFKECLEALIEARDVEKYLLVIPKFLNEVETTEFEENAKLFKPLFHLISLIWIHSDYYSIPSNIVRLLKMFCNFIVNEANKCLETETIFQSELEEILPKVTKVIENMKKYK